ncbi:CoA pyrophosphatase [Pseudokordiimonas caeni]|uniref:CoA pyrophosphatase n=1 Tax=Pseudokordiimonas caeni TaxID=2997908 RepID=UPI002812540E|nr:CoA pyrophosphatase [Pseudokordiimonas caeni]
MRDWLDRALAPGNSAARGLRGDGDLDRSDPVAVSALAGKPLRPAAVLIPIIERSEPTVLLTKRHGGLRAHGGQVSFPGGRIDDTDTGPLAAALRETQEEVGIGPHYVDVRGHLDTYCTVTGFQISPFVGLVQEGFHLIRAEDEVDEIFEVPLAHLLDPRNHQRQSAEFRGRTRHFYVIPHEKHYIWGATAGMIVNLADLMRATADTDDPATFLKRSLAG